MDFRICFQQFFHKKRSNSENMSYYKFSHMFLTFMMSVTDFGFSLAIDVFFANCLLID